MPVAAWLRLCPGRLLPLALACLLLCRVAIAQTCGAAGGDNRPLSPACAGDAIDEPASPAGDAPATATRHPIDVVTGNKYLRHVDAQAPGGLVFARHYNSRNGFARSLGPGWSHSWETAIIQRSPTKLQLLQGDGRRRIFQRLSTPGGSVRWQSADPLAGLITELTNKLADGLAATDRTASSVRYRWRLPDGREMFFSVAGDLVRLSDIRGVQVTLERDADTGRVQAIRNAQGAHLRLEHDAQGRLIALHDTTGKVTRYHYDRHGLLIAVETAQGKRIEHEYGGTALLHGLTRSTDAGQGVAGRFDYDEHGRAVLSQLEGMPSLHLRYRPPARPGQIGETHVSTSDGGHARYRWRYLAHSHRPMILTAEGPGCAACPPSAYQARYDLEGRLLESRSGQGHWMRWQRDASGRVLLWQRRSPASGVAQVREESLRFSYRDATADAPLMAVQRASLAPGKTSSVRWHRDAQGRITAEIRSGFAPDLRSLDAAGRPVRWLPIERRTDFGYAEDPGSGVSRLAWVDGPLPGSEDRIAMRHDAASGALAAITWPGGLTEVRPPQTGVDPAAGGSAAFTRGLLFQPGVHASGPDAWRNFPLPVPDACPEVHTDALGARTRRWRDDFGDLVAEDSPQRGLVIHRRDAAGRLIARVHESGAIESFQRDALGRLLARGDGTDPQRVRYTWEGSRLVAVSDPVQTMRMRHDVQGRLLSRSIRIADHDAATGAAEVVEMTHRFHHDAQGRLVAESLPGGHAIGYGRDAHGRLSAVALQTADGRQLLLARGLQWQTPAHDAAGLLLAGYEAGRVRVSLDHDEQGRLSAIDARTVSVPLSRQRFARDAAGRILRATIDASEQAFVYDDNGWLVGAADEHHAEGFAYDANGNRRVHVRFARNGPEAPMTIDRYHHDRDGRLLAVHRDGSTRDTRWFARLRLGVEGESFGLELVDSPDASEAGGPQVHPDWRKARLRGVLRGPHDRAVAAFAQDRVLALYDHSAEGLRVRKRAADPSRTELYLHRDGLLTGVADARGRLQRWLVRLGHWPLAELRFEGSRLLSVHWFVPDARGLAQLAFDERGKVAWRARWNAFGERQSFTGETSLASEPSHRLAGHWFDPETGRHENGWRSYLPALGRYAQPDPLGPLAGPNERIYARNDPISNIDPFGLYELDVHYYLSFFLARVAGVTPQRAHTVALAAQYVDDNPRTRPENPENLDARALYHFVMAGHDRGSDPTTRFMNPSSPQLGNLYAAALQRSASECARLVFLGEFLHTFEDTFAHRDHDNAPFLSYAGHLRAGHDPDQTYDVVNSAAPPGSLLRHFVDYRWNEERTLRMARESFGVLQRFFGTQPVATFEQIESVVQRFARTGADRYAAWIARSMRPETTGEYTLRKLRELREKITLLDEALGRLGLGSYYSQYADATGALYQARYLAQPAGENRSAYLAGLRHGPPGADPFQGVLLPGD